MSDAARPAGGHAMAGGGDGGRGGGRRGARRRGERVAGVTSAVVFALVVAGALVAWLVPRPSGALQARGPGGGPAAPRPSPAAPSTGSPPSTAPPTTAPATTTTTAPTTTTTAPAGSRLGSSSIGIVTLDLTDSSRTAQLPGPDGELEAQPRPLPTTVLYPAAGGSTTADNPGAPPVPGRHPLIVFASGYDASPTTYGALLDAWARAGFVVAAPVFPLTSSGSARLDENDVVNQPGDVSFVISSVLQADKAGSGVLSGLIDPGAIGVAGHSDGGDTVAALGYNSCCRDSRVKADVVMAGAEWPAFPSTWFTSGGPPLLVVQGTDDDENVPASSQPIYAADGGPKYMLQIQGGGHWTPYSQDPAKLSAEAARRHLPPAAVSQLGAEQLPVVIAATTDFFEAELMGRHGATAALVQVGSTPGVATIASANLG